MNESHCAFSADRVPRCPLVVPRNVLSVSQWILLSGMLTSLLISSNLARAEARANANHHYLVCTDYTQGKVLLIAPHGAIAWEYDAPQCNDIWVLAEGNLLFNTGHGVKEVTRAKKTVFEYQSPSEIYACQRLGNGDTFIAECNTGRLLEVTPSGQIAREIRLLPYGVDGGHLYIRNARKLENGHYLVTHYGRQVVTEYDRTGKTVREIPAAGGPHSAARLPNGNTIITCGDQPGGGRVFEVDPAGQTVWEVKGEVAPGISLKFVAGFHRLPNGNTLVANWLGHGQFGKAPNIIEFGPDKKVVWTYANHERIRTISSLLAAGPDWQALAKEAWH
jgi:hypothetical protein